nr:TolC family outer membrane protein [Oceanococcus sp. HetDA_MAG_MS8]
MLFRSAGIAAVCAATAFSHPAFSGQLLDLYDLAQDADPIVAAARASADAQRAQAGSLRSGILPQLQATGSFTRERDETTTGNVVIQEATVFANNTNYGLRLEQPIFDAAAFARYAQVDDQLAIAMASTALAEQDLIVRLATAYFDWLAAKDNLGFSRAELSAIGRALEQAEVRYEVGLAAITDKQEAQARYDLARSGELAAAAELRSRTQALRNLTGMAPATPAQLQDQRLDQSPAPGDPQTWVEQALEHNLDLLTAEKNAELARQEKKAARAAFLPQLSLVAQHNSIDNTDAQFGRAAEISTISLQASLPLFAGGGNRARFQQANAEHIAAVARAERTRREVEQLTRDAYDGVVTGWARVEALEQAVRSAQSARDAVQAGLEVGTRTNVDLLDAERELFRAKRDLARAQYDYLLSLLRLEQATGDLNFEDLQRIDALLSS